MNNWTISNIEKGNDKRDLTIIEKIKDRFVASKTDAAIICNFTKNRDFQFEYSDTSRIW